jgi:7-cyano-7-deazaguanine synthase
MIRNSYSSNDRVLVLLSGGIDSTVIAHMAFEYRRLVGTLFFDYGQLAARHEAWYASKWAAEHGGIGQCKVVPLAGVTAMLQEPGKEGPRIVPARNLALLSIAVNFASAISADYVWYGATVDDYADYRDCRAEFVGALSRMTEALCGIKIEAPLISMTKREVIQRGESLGVDFKQTWSCYTPVDSQVQRSGPPKGRPCGTCNACISREDALKPLVGRCLDPITWLPLRDSPGEE